jgi:hypothetical protein
MGSVPWHSKKRLGVDAIEIWNGMMWKKSDAAALAWWNRLLVSGERIAAVGGSDSHFRFQSIAYPLNLVYAASNQPNDVLAAVKAGRIVVLSDPSATRVFLRADRDGKTKRLDAMCGDLLPAGDNRTVRFEVLVKHPQPSRQLVLLDKQGIFYTGDVGSGAGWKGNTYRFERSFRATERNFVRAEIRRKKGILRWERLESLCNPIYWVGVKAESPSKEKIDAEKIKKKQSGVPE